MGNSQRSNLKDPLCIAVSNRGTVVDRLRGGILQEKQSHCRTFVYPGGLRDRSIDNVRRCKDCQYGSAAWAKGADLTLIASGVDQLLETVVTGPGIKSPADLKNKKIGISRYGSLTDMALREALRHYQLTPDKDVTILQTGGEATRFAALTSGAIDGAMLSGDKKVQAEKMGFHVVIDLSQLPIYYPVNGVVASKKFVGSNPEVAKNFLKSWLEGIKAFKTDKELSLKVLAKYLKINDRDVLEKSYEIYRPVYKKVPYGDRRAVNFALEQMSKELPEAAKLNADDFIDNRIISELEKSGFIDQIYAEPSRK
jgi:NitT/TauT family transport system substrate-binding protein